MASNPLTDVISLVLGPQVPEPAEASDGTWWKTAGSAFLHDLLERKWLELLPLASDPQVIKESRIKLGLSMRELSRRAGISHVMVSLLESGKKKASRGTLEKIWGALYREHQERKNYVSPDVFVRLDAEFGAVITTVEALGVRK